MQACLLYTINDVHTTPKEQWQRLVELIALSKLSINQPSDPRNSIMHPDDTFQFDIVRAMIMFSPPNAVRAAMFVRSIGKHKHDT